jgi:hypothetical protein
VPEARSSAFRPTVRLPASPAAAAAGRAVRVESHVPDLAAIPARAEQGLAMHDHAAADADLACDVDEILRAGVAAHPVLGARGPVRVIPDGDDPGLVTQFPAKLGALTA